MTFPLTTLRLIFQQSLVIFRAIFFVTSPKYGLKAYVMASTPNPGAMGNGTLQMWIRDISSWK
jgi:hypothetical protein